MCLAGSACTGSDTEEVPVPQEPIATERLYVSDEMTERESDPASRAVFADGYKIVWEAGDQVAINKGDAYPVQQDENGRWYVDLPAAENYTVYYPAELCGMEDNGMFGSRIPATQTYRAGSFDPASLPACAVAKKGEKLVFKYMGSLVKFTLKGAPTDRVSRIALTTTEDGLERFVHLGVIETDADGIPCLVPMSGTFVNYTSNSADLTVDNVPLSEEGVDFYLSIFATTFSKGFHVTVTLADGREMRKKGGVGQTAARGRILAMPALRFEETDPASPVYYSTDNLNWRAWKYDTDGVTPTTLAYPETTDHMLYFKDNPACAAPGLKLAHMQSLHDTFMVNGISTDNGSVKAVNPIGFDFSRTTYESTTFPPYGVMTRWADAASRYNINLRYISLPKNITVLEGAAFYADMVLRKVILPEGLKEIGGSAFCLARGFQNPVDNADNPNFMTENGIYCYATTPPETIGNYAFQYTNPQGFHVPKASLSAYETVWAQFASSARTDRAPLVGDL